MTWTPVKLAAAGLEMGVVLAGLYLLWSFVLSPAARAAKPPAQLAAWTAHPTELLLFLFHAMFGGFAFATMSGVAASQLHLKGDKLGLMTTAGMHLGMLTGVISYYLQNPRTLDAKFGSARAVILSGIATFLIAMPVVFVAVYAWMGVLLLLGLPPERQTQVAIFARLESPTWILFMIVTAGIVAPIGEELLFRLGLFRYLRTRLPRWAGLLLPAALFAAGHVDLHTFGQLTVLGLVFSLAYERTGMIGTTIVAHALFNLNTMFLLLAGVAS